MGDPASTEERRVGINAPPKDHTRPRSHKGRRSPPQGTRNPACSLTLFPVTDTTGVTPLAKPKRIKAQLPKHPPPFEPQTPKYPEFGGTCLDSPPAGPCRPSAAYQLTTAPC